MLGENAAPKKQPNAAWAWEHLRRNDAYRQDYFLSRPGRQKPTTLNTGATLIRERRRWIAAEKWGLLTFADPDRTAFEANVFWLPEHLAGTLPIKLYPIGGQGLEAGSERDEIVLSAIQTRRVLLDTVDGVRHILLSGKRFWVQLHCKNPVPLNDHGCVGLSIRGAKHLKRRLDTADQLLSLYHSTGGKISLIGRMRNSKRLSHGLVAFDIVKAGGTHRDVAEIVFGATTVSGRWGDKDQHFENWSRKLIARVNTLVAGGYLDLLNKKTL